LEAARHRQVAEAGDLPVGAGEHGEHAGRRLGGGGVDGADARMRMRRAQHYAERHAGQDDIVDVAATAAQQARVVEARHRLAQREFSHGSLTSSWPGLSRPSRSVWHGSASLSEMRGSSPRMTRRGNLLRTGQAFVTPSWLISQADPRPRADTLR